MNEIMSHASHAMQYDGTLHWCFLIALAGFWAGLIWGVVRVLLPLRRLAKQAATIADGQLPAFDAHSYGIGEIEQLRRALQLMMEQVTTAQAAERTYRAALTDSQENERLRLAREIHDDTIQSLVVVGHHIERAAHAVHAPASRAEAYLADARALLLQTIDNLRGMIANLRPALLEEVGLALAVEALRDQHPALHVSVVGEAYPLDAMHELALYRAAQEAIHNAERHARATHIEVVLQYAPASVRLEVHDDGIGFCIPTHFQEFARRRHYGLLGIHERVSQLGGDVALWSKANVGTRVAITLPLAPHTSIVAA